MATGIRKREVAGDVRHEIYDESDLIGWVVQRKPKEWHAYATKPNGDGRMVGKFPLRREAISEVQIQRD